tara:strand:- start:1039 stop:2607 length:1569 start_codon:yes stop_codon:yes gene_type:complete
MGTLGSLNTFDEYFLPFQTNPNRGSDSFYTSNPGGENLGSYNFVASNVFKLFNSASAKGIPNGQSVAYIYRFYAGGAVRDHFFKRGSNTPGGYRREGIIGVAYTQNGPYREPIYRFYRGAPYYDHLYSTSSSAPSGYVREGIAWFSPVPVYGCGDSGATNYNQYVNQTNTGCNYTIFGCTDSRASNYNPNANANDGSCTYPQANVSMSLSPSTIIQGQSATLSWSISNSTSRSLSGVGNIASNGSLTVTPSSTTTYTITASYYSYNSDSESKRLTVYEKPDISVSINPTSINVGQSATLSWSTSGDASSMNIQPAPGSTTLNGSLTIEPTVSTTYTLTASGNGGTDTKQVTINVNQPASVSIEGPFSVSYGDTIDIQHSQELSTVRYELQVAVTDLDGVITQDTINLGAASSTPQTTYTYAPTYTNRGPSSIRFTLYGQGAGGLADSDQITVPINIDQLPDVINFPVSEDKLIDQQPVITPDAEITSEQVVVNDIDIPVEIKSDYPVQVQIDDGDFQNIRQI